LIGTVSSGTKTQQDVFNYFPAQTCVMAGGKEVEKYLAEITKQEGVFSWIRGSAISVFLDNILKKYSGETGIV
jgi:hypothetical protein